MRKDAILIAAIMVMCTFYIIKALDGLGDKLIRLVDILRQRKS